MTMGYGLQNLLQSPMAGGQQGQFPDPTDMVSQIMGQFEEWLRKRGTGAVPSGGRQGIQQPVAQQPVQQPAGISPYERAGRLRTAGTQGVGAMMEQAGEEAAEPWKPKGLDIGLLGAAIALPIIAALQPEGRGRRGQRKQHRMSDLFKTLGSFAGQGLQARMGSFESGKKATYGAAETRAEIESEAIGAKYKHTLGGIDLERDIEQREFERDIATNRLGLQKKKLDWEMGKPEKPPFTAGQYYQQGRDVAADKRREEGERQERDLVTANRLWKSVSHRFNLPGGKDFDLKTIQDVDYALKLMQSMTDVPSAMAPRLQEVALELQRVRDSYYGGQSGKPQDMTDAEWQEYLQMKGQ